MAGESLVLVHGAVGGEPQVRLVLVAHDVDFDAGIDVQQDERVATDDRHRDRRGRWIDGDDLGAEVGGRAVSAIAAGSATPRRAGCDRHEDADRVRRGCPPGPVGPRWPDTSRALEELFEVAGEVVGGDAERPSEREPAGVVDDVELRRVGDLDLAGGVGLDEVVTPNGSATARRSAATSVTSAWPPSTKLPT